MKSTGTQTDEQYMTKIKSVSEYIKTIFGNPPCKNRITKFKAVSLDIEDIIIDQLMTKITSDDKPLCSNPYIRNPFEKLETHLNNGFSPIEYCLRNHNKLQTYFKQNNERLEAYEEFVQTFNICSRNKSKFFDKFNKFTYNEDISLVEGVCCFVIWIRNFLKGKILDYLFEFFIFLYTDIRTNIKVDELNVYFYENYVLTDNFPNQPIAEQRQRTVINDPKAPFELTTDFVGYLADFFRGYKAKAEQE